VSISGMQVEPEPAVGQSADAESDFSQKTSGFPQDFAASVRLAYLNCEATYFNPGPASVSAAKI